jgi:hypothetical protein
MFFFLFLNNFLLFFCLSFGDCVNGRKDGELIVLGERNLLHIFFSSSSSSSSSFFFFFLGAFSIIHREFTLHVFLATLAC